MMHYDFSLTQHKYRHSRK